MGRGLAFKRHQETKHREKAKRHLAARWNWTPPEGKPAENPVRIAIHAKTPHPCSCHGCGNPRKHWNEVTMQEKKFEQKCVHDLSDVLD